MGNDTPVSVLSDRPKLLHTYFKQNFAQVTNPPIDSIREELVMSLVTFIGPRPNLLDLEGTSKQKRLEAAHPILTNENLERIRGIGDVADNQFRTVTLDITYGADRGAAGMGEALDKTLQARRSRRARGREHHHPVGPGDRPRPHPDSLAARDQRRASSSDPLRA